MYSYLSYVLVSIQICLHKSLHYLRVSGLISLNMGSRGSRSRKLVASPPVSLWAQHHLCGKLAVQTLPLSLDCGNELKAAEVFGSVG